MRRNDINTLPNQLRAEQLQFLRETAFSKPYRIIDNENILEKSGLKRDLAIKTVYISFFSAFIILIGCNIILFFALRPYSLRGVFPWIIIIFSGAMYYVVNYHIAKMLLYHYSKYK
jgi:glucan phosphoethanolaminetransferase (alkaline phosphatase superfamily)